MKLSSIEAIIGALNEARVQYLIVGGLAVNAYGYERMTRDLDLVIGLASANIRTGLKVLIEIGYRTAIPVSPEEFADPENRATWRREKGMLVLKLWSDIHHRTPIDIFVHEPFDFDVEYARAPRFEIAPALEAPVVRCDTLIAMKAEAGRDRDLLDISELRKLGFDG